MAADQAALHRRAVEEFDARVRAVGDDQWELPTPCSDWNVRQLVNHLVYENRWTVPLMGGSTIAEVGDRYEGDLLGDDPKGAWAESSAEAVAAVRADGAHRVREPAVRRPPDPRLGPGPGGRGRRAPRPRAGRVLRRLVRQDGAALPRRRGHRRAPRGPAGRRRPDHLAGLLRPHRLTRAGASPLSRSSAGRPAAGP